MRETVASSLVGLVSPLEGARRAVGGLRAPRMLVETGIETARALAGMAAKMVPPASTSINGSYGPHRRWTSARATLADVKAIRAGLGGTINDVDAEVVGPWAQGEGLPTDIPTLAAHPTVRTLVQQTLDAVNAHYAKVAQVKRFAILDHDLSVETGADAHAQGQAPGDRGALRRGAGTGSMVLSDVARLLCLHTPGVCEAFYRDASEPAGADPTAEPVDFGRIGESAARNGGIEILGPPPFTRTNEHR